MFEPSQGQGYRQPSGFPPLPQRQPSGADLDVESVSQRGVPRLHEAKPGFRPGHLFSRLEQSRACCARTHEASVLGMAAHFFDSRDQCCSEEGEQINRLPPCTSQFCCSTMQGPRPRIGHRGPPLPLTATRTQRRRQRPPSGVSARRCCALQRKGSCQRRLGCFKAA